MKTGMLLSLAPVLAAAMTVFAAGAGERAAYRNPVIYADCPDPTMCQAGDSVYLVTTTMHFVPGAPHFWYNIPVRPKEGQGRRAGKSQRMRRRNTC